MRVEKNGVVVRELRWRLAARDVGPGAVGAIAVRHGAADVDDHRIAGSMIRSDSWWWGLAPFGPGAHDDEVHGGVAFGDDRVCDIAADLGLGAAGPQPLPHPLVNPVDRLAGASQCVDLVRLACAAEAGAVTSPAATWLACGMTSRKRSTCSAHIRSATATVCAGRPIASAMIAAAMTNASSVSSWLTTLHAFASPACDGAGCFKPRHQQGRVAERGNEQAGQPLEWHRVVADQVAEVGARRDDQRVDAGCIGGGCGGGKAGGVDSRRHGHSDRVSSPAPALRMLRTARHDMIARTDAPDSADPIEQNDPTESTEPNEPIEPIDSADPTDPIDSTEPREPMDRTEPCDRMDQRDEVSASAT